MDPVIIECAINGVTSKTSNPHVPVDPSEIADDALACMEAGAAIIHNHIDLSGVSVERAVERYLAAWRPVLQARPDALLYPTIHFDSSGSCSYEHLAALAEAGMRLGITDPGSVNLGIRGADGLPSGGFVYRNSFDVIGRAFDLCRDGRLARVWRSTNRAFCEPPLHGGAPAGCPQAR